MAGGATLPWVLTLSESEQPEIPFGFYRGGEFSASSASGYSNLAFTVFYQFPLIVILCAFFFFYSSTGTGTSKDDDLVALGAEQSFLGYYIGGGSISMSPSPPTKHYFSRASAFSIFIMPQTTNLIVAMNSYHLTFSFYLYSFGNWQEGGGGGGAHTDTTPTHVISQK